MNATESTVFGRIATKGIGSIQTAAVAMVNQYQAKW